MSKNLSVATILKTGPGSSIQDLGRWGKANFGIPVAGAMDMKSLEWINHLLQNEVYNAVLEIVQPGFQIQFDSPTTIAIAGAHAAIRINGMELERTSLIVIHTNDILEIGAFSNGARIYVGIRHGFKSPKILGSRSFYPEITKQHFLVKGSKIKYFSDPQEKPVLNSKPKWSTDWYKGEDLLAYPGPDFNLLPEKVREKLLNTTFRISQLSNRMGIQLLELLENSLPELLTNPVFPGTVQLTSGGKIIILGQDAQVTGGYPRILQLTEESQWILAQKRPGNTVKFLLKKP